jgi:hypothetical protein
MAMSFHLLVGCMMAESRVFRHVESHSWTLSCSLPHSYNYDAVVCCHIADVTMDGNQEVLLGTYGQHLLIYHYSN